MEKIVALSRHNYHYVPGRTEGNCKTFIVHDSLPLE